MFNNYYDGKVALITGGGSGIGRGLCIALAAEGAKVYCADVNAATAAETAKLTPNELIKTLIFDVVDANAFEIAVAAIVQESGRIDLIFNNAGIAISGEIRDIPFAEWQRIVNINLMGVLYGSQIAYRYMLEQGAGQIVNIASAAGLVEHLALLAPYSVTKHAVVNYSKILRLEAKDLCIKVNVVCPGFISTSIGLNATALNARQGWNEKALLEVAKGVNMDYAAAQILSGVAANKDIIVFPFKAKMIFAFTRRFAGIFKVVMQKILNDYRKNYRINEV